MSASVPRLRVSGLVRRYGARTALDGVSFEVAPGEVFGLLGPNGAGKTTAFRLLAGLLPPDAGEIALDGRPTSPTDRRYRARLGVVFQSPARPEALGPREPASRGRALRPRAAWPAAHRRALRVMELGARADEPPKYSAACAAAPDRARAAADRPAALDEAGPSVIRCPAPHLKCGPQLTRDEPDVTLSPRIPATACAA
jgi:ABC-type glutathione transport system ATPase component